MAMSIGEWTRGPAIGRGSSATVSLAVDHRTGAVFAVKSVAGAARAEELRREHSILQELDSPHVVRCLGLVGCDLFLEHAAGGSLADEIKRLDAGVEEGLIRYRARDVLLGLAHAHAVGVAHCDVKARNVLLAADGRAVLADFGCARRIGINDGKVMGGTPMFMAPEAARGEEQGPAADVWALGCTVVEMATGGGAPWWPRFSDPMAAMRHVAVSGEAPQCPRWMSEDAKDFLGRCFRRDPRERWTAEQLLRHPFVAAAAGDSNNSVPIVAGKEEPFVSPKSVLDQALWDDSTACVTAGASTTTATAPIDRVRELAAGAPVVPDWTWDATWITVHSEDDDVRSTLPEAELEQETSGRYAVAGSTSVAASASGNMTAVAEAVNSTAGDSYGDDAISSRSDRFYGCTNSLLAITSNGFILFITDVLLLLLLLLVLLVPGSQLAQLTYVSHVPFFFLFLYVSFFFLPKIFSKLQPNIVRRLLQAIVVKSCAYFSANQHVNISGFSFPRLPSVVM